MKTDDLTDVLLCLIYESVEFWNAFCYGCCYSDTEECDGIGEPGCLRYCDWLSIIHSAKIIAGIANEPYEMNRGD